MRELRSDPLSIWSFGVNAPANYQALAVAEFGVTIPDPRVRTRMDILFVSDVSPGSPPLDGGTGAQVDVSLASDNKAWICTRVKDKRGGGYPVTNLIGQGKAAALMGRLLQNADPQAASTLLSAGNGILGWSVETNSAADEFYGAVRLGGVGWAATQTVGQFIVQARWIPNVKICDQEWKEIQEGCRVIPYTGLNPNWYNTGA